MSCDTVFYQVGYQMYLHDKYGANFQINKHAPIQKMQKMEVAWGFGRDPGVDLPEQSPGSVPTRQWLYNYWEQFKHYWCKHGNANGSYLQQIAYDDCRTGYQLDPGPGRDRGDRPGLRDRDPAAAGPGVRRAGQRRHPVQADHRRGADLARRQGRQADQAPRGAAPAGEELDAELHQERAGRRRHPGHRGPARSPASRCTRCRSRPRPVPRKSSAARPRRCSRRSPRPAIPSTSSW